jgi:carbon-monoxide dehydrogenase small subunit
MLDGRTVKSCSVLAADVDGCAVETIESLASDIHHLHPLQESFVRNHGQQCGYCTPGMVMAVRQLIADDPDPGESDVRRALAGNICRCTGYQNIVAAAARAAWLSRTANHDAGAAANTGRPDTAAEREG